MYKHEVLVFYLDQPAALAGEEMPCDSYGAATAAFGRLALPHIRFPSMEQGGTRLQAAGVLAGEGESSLTDFISPDRIYGTPLQLPQARHSKDPEPDPATIRAAEQAQRETERIQQALEESTAARVQHDEQERLRQQRNQQNNQH